MWSEDLREEEKKKQKYPNDNDDIVTSETKIFISWKKQSLICPTKRVLQNNRKH